ncbi:hypothetical protein THRCLA_21114 [Thraustotheca clavata]|uniref:Transmembrane protein n=1 Tax=Thraustotheca clavata TaxID=74557 RepID=A0A1W0A0B7_9STRA|nr:hypothetical protein THRCLA_21114 [Thraustotheca clavata]
MSKHQGNSRDLKNLIPSKHGLFQSILSLYCYFISAAGACVVFLIVCDAFINNWALANYLGGGYFFMTPLGAVENAIQLESHYAFAKGYSIRNLSNMGQWMSNYTIVNFVHKTDRIFALSAGEFVLTADSVLCPIFQGIYSVDIDASPTIKLALAHDQTSFFRGHALDIAFGDDTKTNLATSLMKSAELMSLGYIPGRTTVDKRFTHVFTIKNTSAQQSQLVSYFRVFSRNFCTGCDPVAELGHSTCNFTMSYDYKSKTLNVLTGEFVPGSTYKLGFIQTNGVLGVVSLYTKLVAIFFAVSGYLASRRTVQWLDVDPTKTYSIVERLLRIVVPKYFPHPSNALRFDMFLFNSDIFVFLYAISVILDVQNAFLYARNVNLYNSLAPQFGASLQLFMISFRLLWINCATLKLFKMIWNLLGMATFCGESKVMAFLNLSSVVPLYLSVILLFFVPPFIEYNNSVTHNLDNAIDPLDGICVLVSEGSYMRVAPTVALGLLANILIITALDHIVHYSFWKKMVKNSLSRQAIYNSTSIVCDFISDIETRSDLGSEYSVILCRARRLSTLQWFFMSHMTCFGLPEKDLQLKKRSLISIQVKSPRGKASINSVGIRESSQVEPTSFSEVANSFAEDGRNSSSFIVVQDGDQNIHLLDDNFNDITSLVYNIKVLKDTAVCVK